MFSVIERLDPEGRRALFMCVASAYSSGTSSLDCEDLLVALLNSDSSAGACAELGVDRPALLRALGGAAVSGNGVNTPDTEPGAAAGSSITPSRPSFESVVSGGHFVNLNLPLSRRAAEVLAAVGESLASMRAESVTPLRAVLAILEANSEVNETATRFGLGASSVRQHLGRSGAV